MASTQNLLKEFRSIPGQSLVHSRLIDILVPMQKFKILVYLIFFLVHIYFYFSESKNTEKQLLDLELLKIIKKANSLAKKDT